MTNDIRERILNAAEHILMSQGLDAVSLRAVTAEAGVNIAAVNYYFGSKAALLQTMTQRHFAPINQKQLRRLEVLEAKDEQISVDALLLAYVTPLYSMFDEEYGREWMQAKIIAYRAEPSPHVNDQTESMGDAEVTSRYFEVLRHVLPTIPANELWWRFERARNLLLANQSRRLMSPEGQHITERSKQHERAWLISFLSGAMQAPMTEES